MLTIAYVTFRKAPRFDWFARSLARELRASPDAPELQILVVDGRLWADDDVRRCQLLSEAAGLIGFQHVPPKPTVWQGPHRLTSKDYFCAANTRNTAFALARGSHVAFVDDLSVLLPGWLNSHVHAMKHGYVLCGSTCKNNNIVVDDAGNIVSFDPFPPGQDSRMPEMQRHESPFQCNGGWLYGGTFSVPLELALAVNGQDEQCDTIGGEDYDFGSRLERAGAVIRATTIGTFEDEDGHHAEAPMVRLDKPWPGEHGPYSSNYLLHRLQSEPRRTQPLGNNFDLRELRAKVLAGEPFPVPTEPSKHWVDGQPLSEM
jgi:hypothetical protein